MLRVGIGGRFIVEGGVGNYPGVGGGLSHPNGFPMFLIVEPTKG